jgi:hypothetical protein
MWDEIISSHSRQKRFSVAGFIARQVPRHVLQIMWPHGFKVAYGWFPNGSGKEQSTQDGQQ